MNFPSSQNCKLTSEALSVLVLTSQVLSLSDTKGEKVVSSLLVWGCLRFDVSVSHAVKYFVGPSDCSFVHSIQVGKIAYSMLNLVLPGK